MLLRFTKRLLFETDPRVLARFAGCGWKGMRALHRFEKRQAAGRFFPPFLFLSLTDRCNLSCRGCWVTPASPPRDLDLPTLDRIVATCKEQGATFFGLLGGEPLLHEGLFDLIGRHRDCYFQVFTNGTLITAETAREMRRLGNVTPLVSIEGRATESDARRGGEGVYDRALAGLEHCRRNRLVTGVASSICHSNIDELATPEFVNDVMALGAHYLWYYIYRPAGRDPAPELALTSDEIVRLRRFIVDIRMTAPILIIDAYWDHEGRALCPAAMGISHHVNPAGEIEPCPPIQFARDNVADSDDLAATLDGSAFLKRFREKAAATTRGCILLERPDILREFMVAEQARDTSGRDSGLQELANMTPADGHHMPGREIPERSRLYRFAKKHWFFGFGAYG